MNKKLVKNLKKMKNQSKIITSFLISIFLFSNIIFVEEIRFQDDNANSKGLSENQTLIAPEPSGDLYVIVSPGSASKTYGNTQTFTYSLSDMLEGYSGEWWIKIDGGPWVSQGTWTLIWENGMGTYYNVSNYTTSSDLSCGNHDVHARFYSLDNADEYKDATIKIVPPVPTDVETNDNPCYNGSALITWTKSSEATNYQLYNASTFDGEYTKIGSELGDVSSANVYEISERNQYYKISAGNNFVWSALSTSFAQVNWLAPETPTIISPINQTVYTQEPISVIRDPVGSYVDEFDWEISIDGGTYTDWSTNSSDTLSYDPAEGDHTYQFRLRVRNVNFGIWTDYCYSGIVTLSTSLVPLNIQTSESICYNGSVIISWDTVSEAINYTLYEATTVDGEYAPIITGILETSINVSKTTNETLYFKVKAINEVGESDFSDYVSVSWSVPESPTITSPITEVVEYLPSFSVTRDSVESYVDEYDWETSIDGGVYANWSTGELNTLTYDTIEGNHTYQFRLRVRNSDFGIWSDYGYSGILTIIEADVYTNGTWQNLIEGINTLQCDDESNQIWMLVMVACLDVTQIRLTYFESNPTSIGDPDNLDLNYFYLLEVEDISKIQSVSVTFYFGDANLSSEQLSNMSMYQHNTSSWFKPNQIQRKEFNSIFIIGIDVNTYYALGIDLSSTGTPDPTSFNIPGYDLPVMLGFMTVVIVFLKRYRGKFKK